MFSLCKKKGQKKCQILTFGEYCVEMSKVKEEEGCWLLEMSPPASCWPVEKDHGSAGKEWQTLLSYETHHFLRGHSTSESGESKSAKLCEESCEATLLSPCILMTRTPRPAEQRLGSTMGERCSPSKEQTHGAEIVSMLWLLRCFRQTLNLREEFLCFQSLNDFSSLGYWPKGTEKCNVDSKLPIKKKILLH